MTENYTTPPTVYRNRRAQLAKQIDRPLVILAGYAPARNYAANTHPFRAGSSYLYFGGPVLEGAGWLIEPGSDGDDGCTLLRPAPGPDDALWFGSLPDDRQLAAAAGISPTRIADPAKLTDLLNGRTAGVIHPPHPEVNAFIARHKLDPATETDRLAVIELRLIKDEYELAALRYAAKVTVEAHSALAAAVRPGATEAELEGEFQRVLFARCCTPSFTPIVTVHGEVLHGANRGLRLEAGGLLLADAGAEETGGYAGDVTRTYPILGKFDAIQRMLYDAVCRAKQVAIAACVPGKRYREVHELAARVLCEGLIEADLLRGDPDELAQRGAYTLFFPHGVGHLLGLDGHDMEDFGDLAGYAPGRTRPTRFGDKYLRLDRDLEPGMVVTIEPGIYLVPSIWQRDDLASPFADAVNRPAVEQLLERNFGGIRLEDDIVITAGEPENLTANLASDAAAAERMVGASN